jgi:hypothetical protein
MRARWMRVRTVPFGDAECHADLCRGHLFECGEYERLAELFGQGVDEAVDARDAAARNRCCFRRVICRCDGIHFHATLLSGRPSLPVARHAPHDTCQIRALVFDFLCEALYLLCEAWDAAPRPLLMEAQKAFLYYIVGVAAIAQHGPSHAEGEAEVALDEGLEDGFVRA